MVAIYKLALLSIPVLAVVALVSWGHVQIGRAILFYEGEVSKLAGGTDMC